MLRLTYFTKVYNICISLLICIFISGCESFTIMNNKKYFNMEEEITERHYFQKRCLLGVSIRGEVIQQREWLYLSSNLESDGFWVGAGTEATILETSKDTSGIKEIYLLDVPDNFGGKTGKGWILKDKVKTLGEIYNFLLKTANKSQVICTLIVDKKEILYSEALIMKVEFENLSSKPKVIFYNSPLEYNHLVVRHAELGIPLLVQHQQYVGFHPHYKESKLEIKELKSGEQWTLKYKYNPMIDVSSTKISHNYDLFIIYQVRNSIDAGMYFTGVSNIIKITICSKENNQ